MEFVSSDSSEDIAVSGLQPASIPFVVAVPARSIASLAVGESAVIEGIDADLAGRERFVGLGFTPGVAVKLLRRAPFGDPLGILVRGTRFALRLADARKIRIAK